jgi:hypothetical protein
LISLCLQEGSRADLRLIGSSLGGFPQSVLCRPQDGA